MPIIRICLTGDMHGRLTNAMSRAIHNAKSSAPSADGFILLDAGDAITATNITWNLLPETILTKMGKLGYDAMACGNREFHFSRSGFAAKHRGAQFAVLSSNIVAAKRSVSPVVSPYVILERLGVKFGIVGFTEEMITEKMLRNPFLRAVSSWVLLPAVDAAADMIPIVKPKCDVLIALTHVGTADDRSIAQLGYDLVLGGHDHSLTEKPIEVGGGYVLHSGYHGKHLGIIDYDTELRTIVKWQCIRVTGE